MKPMRSEAIKSEDGCNLLAGEASCDLLYCGDDILKFSCIIHSMFQHDFLEMKSHFKESDFIVIEQGKCPLLKHCMALGPLVPNQTQLACKCATTVRCCCYGRNCVGSDLMLRVCELQ